MREIKFRAKDIKTNKWVYGGYYKHLKRTPCPIGDSIKKDDYEHLIINSGFSDWNMPKPIDCFAVDEKTVGEYVGVRDKHGKEVYEGDILRDDNGKLYKIVWGHDLLWLAKTNETHCNCYDPRVSERSEIIGNIHDNPELDILRRSKIK